MKIFLKFLMLILIVIPLPYLQARKEFDPDPVAKGAQLEKGSNFFHTCKTTNTITINDISFGAVIVYTGRIKSAPKFCSRCSPVRSGFT